TVNRLYGIRAPQVVKQRQKSAPKFACLELFSSFSREFLERISSDIRAIFERYSRLIRHISGPSPVWSRGGFVFTRARDNAKSPTQLNQILPNLTKSCEILPSRTNPCRILPNRTKFCQVLPFRANSCQFLQPRLNVVLNLA